MKGAILAPWRSPDGKMQYRIIGGDIIKSKRYAYCIHSDGDRGYYRLTEVTTGCCIQHGEKYKELEEYAYIDADDYVEDHRKKSGPMFRAMQQACLVEYEKTVNDDVLATFKALKPYFDTIER